LKGALPDNLPDIEAIKQLKARYFRYLDTKQWEKWRGLFTDDCALPEMPYESIDDLVATISAQRQDATTVHQGHTPEIVLLAADRARGIWAMSDYVEFPEPAREGRAGGYRGFVGAGHYEEEYRKDGGTWRISSMRLTRLRVAAIVDDPVPQITGYPSSGGDSWLPAE
jgi:hypothetical protein